MALISLFSHRLYENRKNNSIDSCQISTSRCVFHWPVQFQSRVQQPDVSVRKPALNEVAKPNIRVDSP